MLLNGKAPLPGQIMRFPDLGRTFRAVAEHGKDGFYTGRIAEAIVELIRSKGGVMELEDLEKHKTTFVEPISYTYNNEVTVYEVSICDLRDSPTTHSLKSVRPTVKVSRELQELAVKDQ